MIETPQARPPGQKLETLEVVRAFAALAVVGFHATDLPFRRGYAEVHDPILFLGKYGVHVFFVLSGFIIFYIHGKDLGNPERAPNYFWRRWVRIWPLYAVVTLLQVLGKPLLLGKPSDEPVAIITSLLFLDLENPTIIAVGWTLVHEAFFYLVFGILIVIGRRLSVWFLVFFLIGQVMIWLNPEAANPLVAFIFSPLKWYFIAGIGAACWLISSRDDGKRGLRKVAIVLFTLMMMIGVAAIMSERPAVAFFLAPSIALVLLGLTLVDLKFSAKLPTFLVFLGAASYSIYLVHANILDVGLIVIAKKAPELIENYLGPVMLVLAVASVIFGIVFHLFIEKPLLFWIRRIHSQS